MSAGIGRCCLIGILLIGAIAAAQSALADDGGATRLKRLSLEELMQVKVTSPSRKPESLRETAAAVYVITQEDIHIPVVVLTSSDADEDVLRAYKLQASCYVKKPVLFEDFLRTIGLIDEFWLNVVKLPRDTG